MEERKEGGREEERRRGEREGERGRGNGRERERESKRERASNQVGRYESDNKATKSMWLTRFSLCVVIYSQGPQ